MDKWTQLGPWVALESLPQQCAKRSSKPLAIVGPELEARLRDGRIPSRIDPNCVTQAEPIRVVRASQLPSALKNEPAAIRVPGTVTGTTASTYTPPRPSMPGRTSDPTVAGNGGWDQVNWNRGATIGGCAIEAHWPSVLEMVEALQQPSKKPPTKPTGKTPDKGAAVERMMRDAIRSGSLTLKQLSDIPKKALPAQFGAGETTCYDIRKKLLDEAD